jgi:hypothetical protein
MNYRRLAAIIIFGFIIFESTLIYAESAARFLRECNVGCSKTPFTFDSERISCTLNCQKQAADIGRLNASRGKGLTCEKAKIGLEKGLVRIGYDKYKKLDVFYDENCKY